MDSQEPDQLELVGAAAEPASGDEADPGVAVALGDDDAVVGVAVAPNDARSFRIFQFRVDADGAVRGKQREQLPKQVYGRTVALRYLTYYAKQLAEEDLLVLVDVTGSVVNVAQGLTGRLKPLMRRQMRKILAEHFAVARQPSRRTSRPASKSQATKSAGARRTSRRPGRR